MYQISVMYVWWCYLVKPKLLEYLDSALEHIFRNALAQLTLKLTIIITDVYLFISMYIYHRVIILNRGSMFAFQWREFSPPLSSAHRLPQSYHSQWEIEDAAIQGNSPSAPCHYRAISQWATGLEWRHAVTLYILVGKICISFFLFYCEGMLSIVVLDYPWPVGSS